MHQRLPTMQTDTDLQTHGRTDQTMKRIFAMTLAATFAFPLQANAKSSFDDLVLAEHFYYRLAQCETGQTWNHETLSYTSGFGIARGVWQRYSHATQASRYTPRQQAQVVDRIVFTGFHDGRRFWPPVGPWGFGAIRTQNCMNLQKYICKSRKPIVQRWKRNCSGGTK